MFRQCSKALEGMLKSAGTDEERDMHLLLLQPHDAVAHEVPEAQRSLD